MNAAQEQAYRILGQYFDFVNVVFSDILALENSAVSEYAVPVRFISNAIHNFPEFISGTSNEVQAIRILEQICWETYRGLQHISIPSIWEHERHGEPWQQICRSVASVIDQPPAFGRPHD